MNEKAREEEPTVRGLRAYLRDTRSPAAATLLVLPLFIAYQIGVLSSGGVKNGVDFVTLNLMRVIGDDIVIYLAVNAGVLVLLLLGVFFLGRRGRFRPQLWPVVILESTVYALFFGGLVNGVMRFLHLDALLIAGLTPGQKVVQSLGAGFYEELVFRLLLLGGMFLLFTRVLRVPRVLAAVIAVIASSLLFSGVHHIGSLADEFTLGVFLFRFVAGMILALIFVLRGFAVAVYTHAIYDIIVFLFAGES